MKNGIVVLNKPEGITSQTAVNIVKRAFGVKKAGHTGTLDPMATGVLPIMLGSATKASDFIMDSKKHYRAELLLGVSTDTEDVTGNITEKSEVIPSEDAVFDTVSRFIGEIYQIPPMYSAIKVGGKKLMDLARSGVEIEREARKITVFSMTAEKISEREYRLDVVCSKGTYIRTLCADIGKALGCGGCMKALMRLESGGFSIDEAITPEELSSLSGEELEKRVVSTENALEKYKSVSLDAFFARLAHCGQEIYLKKIKADFPLGTILRLSDENGFFALGEVREFEDGLAIKPIRQF